MALAEIAATLGANLRSLKVADGHLIARIDLQSPRMRITQSAIPHPKFVLENALPIVATPILVQLIKDQLKNGFTIGAIAGLALEEADVQFLDKTVQLDATLKFQDDDLA